MPSLPNVMRRVLVATVLAAFPLAVVADEPAASPPAATAKAGEAPVDPAAAQAAAEAEARAALDRTIEVSERDAATLGSLTDVRRYLRHRTGLQMRLEKISLREEMHVVAGSYTTRALLDIIAGRVKGEWKLEGTTIVIAPPDPKARKATKTAAAKDANPAAQGSAAPPAVTAAGEPAVSAPREAVASAPAAAATDAPHVAAREVAPPARETATSSSALMSDAAEADEEEQQKAAAPVEAPAPESIPAATEEIAPPSRPAPASASAPTPYPADEDSDVGAAPAPTPAPARPEQNPPIVIPIIVPSTYDVGALGPAPSQGPAYVMSAGLFASPEAAEACQRTLASAGFVRVARAALDSAPESIAIVVGEPRAANPAELAAAQSVLCGMGFPQARPVQIAATPTAP